MKRRRLLSLTLALLLVVSLLPMGAMAEDIQQGTRDDITIGQTIENNYGDVGGNEGTIINNGAENGGPESGSVIFNSGTIENNYGTVGIKDNNGNIVSDSGNYGTIKTNNGTVYNNQIDGTVETNNGTVYNNQIDGTIKTNNGTIDTNNGFVGDLDEYDNPVLDPDSDAGNFGNIGVNNGEITINGKNATVDTNNFVVYENNGDIGTNNDYVDTNNGDIGVNNGKIDINGENATVGTNNGDVYENNGDIGTNNDFVDTNNGDIGTNNDFVTENNGNIGTNNGEVGWNYGTVETNNGKVRWNYGTVETNTIDGVVYNETDMNGVTGEVKTNYGTIKTPIGKEDENGQDFEVQYGVQVQNTDGGAGTKLLQAVESTIVKLAELFQRDGYELVGYEDITPTSANTVQSGDPNTPKLSATDFQANRPSILSLLWSKISSAVAPSADSPSSGSDEPEATPVKVVVTPTKVAAEDVKVGTVVQRKGMRFQVIEMDDGSILVATVGKLSKKDIEDMKAFLAKYFTAEQLEMLLGDPELLSDELVAKYFGGNLEHICFRAAKNIFAQ